MANTIVKTYAYYASLLTDDIDPTLAAPTKLAAAKVGVGVAVFSPGPFSTIADCGQAASTGLGVSATIVWDAPLNEVDGSVSSLSPSILFRATVVVAETVTNVYVTDGGTALFGCALISPTVPIAAVGDGFAAIISWNQGQTPGNCNVVVVT